MPIKVKQLEKALIRKGFTSYMGGKHKTFVYAPDGKLTDIKTSVSHDGKELGETIIHYMYQQLKLENKKMLENLAECTLSREALYEYYKNKDYIKNY